MLKQKLKAGSSKVLQIFHSYQTKQTNKQTKKQQAKELTLGTVTSLQHLDQGSIVSEELVGLELMLNH